MGQRFILIKEEEAVSKSKHVNLSINRMGLEMRRLLNDLDPVKCVSLLMDTYGEMSFFIKTADNGGFQAWLLEDRKKGDTIYLEAWCYQSLPRFYIFVNRDTENIRSFIRWLHHNTCNIRYLKRSGDE